jgi:hypothetical protein
LIFGVNAGSRMLEHILGKVFHFIDATLYLKQNTKKNLKLIKEYDLKYLT